MKKFLKIALAVIGAVGVLTIAASFFLAPNFKQYEQRAKDAELKAILTSVYTMAQVAYVEKGEFPPTITELDIPLSPEALKDKVLTYQGSGKNFSAQIERGNVKFTIDQDKNIKRIPPL